MTIKLTPLTDPDFRPFSRRIAWLASDAAGHPVGSAFLRLHSRESMAHLAELEITVHPAERRRGVGSQLLYAALAAARDQNARMVVADVGANQPPYEFLVHHGFTVGVTLIFARLDLAADVPAVDPPAGYRVVTWQGVVPDELLHSFTDARRGMDDAPTGAIDYGTDRWDAARTRQAAELIAQRGEHLMTVAVVEEASGEVVAFTELVVPGDGKGDAQNYGTAVLPAHRGRGLARCLKSEQIRWVRTAFPDLGGLLTDTVDTNVAMRHLNAALGYVPTHTVHRCLLDLTSAQPADTAPASPQPQH
ncbi:GNAT family N-acetyltransferase [Kribbella albertanoniae]|uniref:GNAT family N-acetyltransferase n=1 Tax=Kribbella albertanoniae TaxID=1266829 RepID=A0A4R4PPA6_9ACTN|nr:GNAT family N-acetyltransferase [Kribbella albertanoniae]TDC23998.1 GNAT family N-acetyltransferase [Kribbella albertanoniae]